MTTNESAAVIGKRVVFTGGPCAAEVEVIDARTAFGRDDYKVRDCLGRERWVSAQACKVVNDMEAAGADVATTTGGEQ